jgi:hypothetical protein
MAASCCVVITGASILHAANTTHNFSLLYLGLCVLTTEHYLSEGAVLQYTHTTTQGVLSCMHAYKLKFMECHTCFERSSSLF